MPELPEVETVRRIIEPQIVGWRVISAEIRNASVIAHPSTDEFIELVAGRAFEKMSRRGKFLCFALDNGDRLFLHLRMTGQLLVAPRGFPVEKHTHLIFELSDGNELRYIDTRRFGRFWYVKQGGDVSVTGVDKLGLEPDDTGLSAAYLKERLGAKHKPIKEMLLGQSVVAGIGNIYSDEILFASGICPLKRCCELTDGEWEALASNIPRLMAFYTEKNAITPEEYLLGGGKEYRNTPFLRVYGHAGQPCPVCGTPFVKTEIGGRGSVYCPACQKNEP